MANVLDVTEKKAHILKANKPLVDWLLTLNTNNRNVKKSHLAWIAESIEKKEFILTGQGISVSETGKLVDGQHRLMAIKEAGYPPVELMVVTGLDDKARIYVDQNAKRSSADMLKIVLNQSVTSKMTAVLNCHLQLRDDPEGFVLLKGKPDLEDLVEQMAEHASLIDRLIAACGPIGRSGTLCGFFHYALRYNEDRAIALGEMMASGENLVKADPAYRLRERVTRGVRGTMYGSTGKLEDYKYAVTACIADALNVGIETFRPSSSWNELPPKLGRYLVKKQTA